ncbi:MAG TPA: hypothetical protein VKV22_01505 [Rhodanobacteraceae bacterium]|nr:hypothetical protein [Rhodanobacteraceae bacterium]
MWPSIMVAVIVVVAVIVLAKWVRIVPGIAEIGKKALAKNSTAATAQR